ncbi:MAG: 6-phosphogluconolactonase [Polyangiales bacterium]
MSGLGLQVVDGAAGLVDSAAAMFVDGARRAILERGRFVVALTGGSTPVPLHRALAALPYRAQIEWPRVHVVFGDERAVAATDPRSNYGAAKRDLLDLVPLPADNVHRMPGDSADLAAAAIAYEATLRDLCEGEVDLLFVGIGKDGHILSLHPGAAAIAETRALVVAELDPPMDPAVSRLTMTPVALERARSVVALASGAEKADAVRRAVDSPDDPQRTPAHLLRRARAGHFVIDASAAGKLAARRTSDA